MMKMTLSKINNSEWKLSRYNTQGKPCAFFILRQNGDKYYTAPAASFEPIKEQIKEWLLEEAIPKFYSRKLGSTKTDMDFEFSIITSIIREQKLKQLGI